MALGENLVLRGICPECQTAVNAFGNQPKRVPCWNCSAMVLVSREGDQPLETISEELRDVGGGGLPITQESKYTIFGDKIVNRETGTPIPSDEPIMIFRAKDSQSIHALTAYLTACTDPVHRVAIAKRMNDFLEYQANNPALVMEPDTKLWPNADG